MIPRNPLSNFTDPNRNGWEALPDTIYDYRDASLIPVTFFQQPIGVGGREFFDTNMVLAGMLPSGVEFLIREIEFAFLTSSKREYANLAKHGRLRFQIGDRIYFDLSPLGMFMRPWTVITNREGIPIRREERYPWLQGPYPAGAGNQGGLFVTGGHLPFAADVWWEHDAPVKITKPGRLGVLLHGLRYRRHC